jgi:hypothetical protein
VTIRSANFQPGLAGGRVGRALLVFTLSVHVSWRIRSMADKWPWPWSCMEPSKPATNESMYASCPSRFATKLSKGQRTAERDVSGAAQLM